MWNIKLYRYVLLDVVIHLNFELNLANYLLVFNAGPVFSTWIYWVIFGIYWNCILHGECFNYYLYVLTIIWGRGKYQYKHSLRYWTFSCVVSFFILLQCFKWDELFLFIKDSPTFYYLAYINLTMLTHLRQLLAYLLVKFITYHPR